MQRLWTVTAPDKQGPKRKIGGPHFPSPSYGVRGLSGGIGHDDVIKEGCVLRHTRMLAYGAITLWTAGAAGCALMSTAQEPERLEGGYLLILAAAVAMTYLWRTADGNGSQQTRDLSFQAGYITGREEERQAQQNAQRIRSVDIDGVHMTVIGGKSESISDETLALVRELRRTGTDDRR